MDVSENRGTPKSSILIGFSIINPSFWGTPIFGNTHMRKSCHQSPHITATGYLPILRIKNTDISAHLKLPPATCWLFEDVGGLT